jgi:hypothetical protein
VLSQLGQLMVTSWRSSGQDGTAPTASRWSVHPKLGILDRSLLKMSHPTMYVFIMSEQFSKLLRRAIEESGMSHYAIGINCRIDQAVISRFMAGKGGFNLATIDKLVEGLGIQVKLPRAKRAK